MNPPNLLALIALEAVARHGSVTRAAQALHLTQSAVSHRLRGFERELGLPLLEHVGRGVRLSPAAHELARAAGVAISQLEQAIAQLTPERAARVMSISCSPSFAIRFLVPRLTPFRQLHPELDLRVAAADVAVDPAHGADVSVHLASGATPRLWSEKLIDEVVFPVVSPYLLERTGALREPKDLGKHTLLHDDALFDEPGRIGWATWFAHAGERDVDSSRGVRFSHAYLALEAALAADGVALARRSLVAEDLARGRLVAPFRSAVPSGLAYWFVSASDPDRRPAVAVLRAFLKQQLTAAQRTADRVLAQRGPTTPKRGQRRPRG